MQDVSMAIPEPAQKKKPVRLNGLPHGGWQPPAMTAGAHSMKKRMYAIGL
jgi:hypothetical protein